MDSKEQEGHSLVKNKHRILNCSRKKIVLGGPREREARKVPRKVKNASLTAAFALINQKRAQAVILIRTRAEARTKKEKARNALILNLDFQPQKHQVKKEMTGPANQTYGIPASLTFPQTQFLSETLHGVARDILHGWHQSL